MINNYVWNKFKWPVKIAFNNSYIMDMSIYLAIQFVLERIMYDVYTILKFTQQEYNLEGARSGQRCGHKILELHEIIHFGVFSGSVLLIDFRFNLQCSTQNSLSPEPIPFTWLPLHFYFHLQKIIKSQDFSSCF